MTVIDRPIGSITPYERNAKLHGEEQIENIAESIRQFGFKQPIVIDAAGIIVAGHGRYHAAQRLGLETVPCILADDLTPEQVRAYRILDNKIAESPWDTELLRMELDGIDLSAFSTDLLDLPDIEAPADEDVIEIVEDDFNEEDTADTTVQRGDLYRLGDHLLMCGDATDRTDVEKLTGAPCALLITDPPYNVDYHGRAGSIQNDNLADAEFRKFLTDAFRAAAGAIKPGAAFYIWHADGRSTAFRDALDTAGLTVKECLIWVKSQFTLGRQDYQWQHEPCLYGWKDGAAHYFIDDRTQSTVIEDARPKIRSMTKDEMRKLLEDIYSDRVSTTVMHEDKPPRSAEHPTMKPVKLIARLIRNSSRTGETVLDTFGGSGTTLIACEQLGRSCRMMELDPHYVQVIIDRWEKFTGRKAEKL